MAKRASKKKRKKKSELNEILRRVDQLPVLDDQRPDEIIGHDESGVPSSGPSPAPVVSVQREDGSWESFDFAAYKKKVLKNPASRAVIEDFLKNRHREWEPGLGARLIRRQKGRARKRRKGGR